MKGSQFVVFAVFLEELGQGELGFGPCEEYHAGGKDVPIRDGAQLGNCARRAGNALLALELGLVLLPGLL